MKHLTINQTTYTIPTSWEEITIEQQLAVERLAKENPDYKPLALIAGYTSTDIDVIKRMNIKDVKVLIDNLQLIKTPLPTGSLNKFEFKGYTYNVLPTLLKGETQDFISLETLIQNHKENLYTALPTIVAILAKRKDESLDSFDVEERSLLFKDLPITIANRLYVFFCLTGILFTNDSHKILQVQNQQIQVLITSMQNTLRKSAGGGLSSRLLKVTLRSYLKSLESNWKKLYSGYN